MNQNISPTIVKGVTAVDSAETGSERLPKTMGQLIRYAVNCGAVFLVKLVLVIALTPWLMPAVAYFFVHIVTFFLSYALHCRRTFDVSISTQSMKNYFFAVILFKILDYTAFGVLVMAFHLTAPLSVFLVSAGEALLKFFAIRYALHRDPNSLPLKPSKESAC